MANAFADGTGSRWDGGTTNADLSVRTDIMWFRLSALTSANRRYIGREGSTTGWRLQAAGASFNEFALTVRRATTGTNVTTSDAAMVTGVDYCVALTIDRSGASPVGRIYIGSAGSAMRECAYSAQTDGSGTFTSDAANNLILFNTAVGGFVAAPGGICSQYMAVNRILTLAQVEAIRLRPTNVANVVRNIQLGTGGTAGATDVSGGGVNGTLTSVTLASPHWPFPLYRSFLAPVGNAVAHPMSAFG